MADMQMRKTEQSKKTLLNIDELLVIVGEFGRFQKIITLMFCLLMFPTSNQVLIMSFAVNNPPWRCATNSTVCLQTNTTFSSKDTKRCSMQRRDWEYITPRDYSVVTEFDLVCDKEWLIEFPGSVVFFGFIFGAAILGWCMDNYGRLKVNFLSVTVVLILGFLNIFVGNIYLFIACRFLIGFFLSGTYPQIAVMISEIIGNKHRALCNNLTYASTGFSFLLMALKGYLSPNWKLLFILNTIPYYFVLLFYIFIPESVRYLRVKGQTDQAMAILKKVAYWNKKELPSDIGILPVTNEFSEKKSSPLDLFKTTKMAKTSSVLGFSSFANSMAYYCVYLAAGDISGHMYRDFVIITIIDIPVSIITAPLLEKYGRKKVTQLYMFIGSVSCIALGVTPSVGKMKILRIFFGMLGKACVVGSTMSRAVWALELFPTHIRGGGTGMGQVLNKIGATSSAWIDKDMSKIFKGGAFILIGVVSFISMCFQMILPETQGRNTADTVTELKELSEESSQHTMDNERERGVHQIGINSYENPISCLDESS